LLSAYDVLWGAILNFSGKNIFDEKLLMSIASIGAFIIGQYIESICVIVLYGIGEIFENIAVDKSRNRIRSLLEIKQDYANVYDGESDRQVPISNVGIGALIHIKPGERVPLDGVVVEGTSYLDVSAITGESRQKVVTIGDNVLSGSINGSSVL
jgi:Cd2+/Zn2+-exporting ATPase